MRIKQFEKLPKPSVFPNGTEVTMGYVPHSRDLEGTDIDRGYWYVASDVLKGLGINNGTAMSVIPAELGCNHRPDWIPGRGRRLIRFQAIMIMAARRYTTNVTCQKFIDSLSNDPESAITLNLTSILDI